MLFASQLRRFRGCAAEACFKAFAMAKHGNLTPQRPTEYYVRYDSTGREEMRHDEAILQEMWELTQRVLHVLEAHGIILKWAQSTYHRKPKDTDSRVATRTWRKQFCVDLTVVHLGRTLWLEFKYTEAAQWGAIVGQAGRSVDFWGQVVKTPEDWKLDSNLGGGPLLPPCAMGTLVSSFVQFRLDVSSPRFLIDHAFEAPAESRPARKRPPRETRSLNERRALLTRVVRKQRRKVMATGPVLKRPATQHSRRRV
jgi:hypothetical protein